MLCKKFDLLLLLLISFFVFSCKVDTITDTSANKPNIQKIVPEEIHPFDLVTIYGENLGETNDSSFILIDSLYTIPSKYCIKWNNSFIQFYAPKNLFKGLLRVVINSDTTNPLMFNYFPYPKIDLVRIESGTFLMGSNKGLGYEQPVHQVVLTRSFYISKYEITQKQWNTLFDTNESPFIGDNLPVSNVSWFRAILFCNKLSKLMGYDTCYVILDTNLVVWDTLANGFRLPTEAEWEYACRAGSQNEFAGNGNPLDMGWFDVNSGMKPHPVGEKLPNDWGIYDMHGNVWEWCWDWFDPFYYEKSPKVNPRGPATGKVHIVRGGCWQRGTTFGRSSSRQFPEDQSLNFGFRVVRNAN